MITTPQPSKVAPKDDVAPCRPQQEVSRLAERAVRAAVNAAIVASFGHAQEALAVTP